MTRLGLILALAWSTGAAAQDIPQVSVELAEETPVVGQPYVISIKVLVPTWLPAPPRFPTLEVPGLLVRLPERASGPVSETVGGESWSGVQRRYRLYPLQPGSFEIPGQTLRVTYADPDSSEPVTADETLEPIRFEATMPEGARDLDPPIVAGGFTLEAEVETPETLAVGDAVVRTLTAKIDGTTAILIPALTPAGDDAALRVYPDEPKVTETEERGVLSGQRVERTTYLASAEGTAELPAIRFDWFNLDTGQVETAEVPAVPLTIAKGTVTETAGGKLPWRALVGILAVLTVLAGLFYRFGPRLRAMVDAARARWRASEPHAWRRLKQAVAARDLPGLYPALDRWAAFHPGLDRRRIDAALLTLGQARFGAGASGEGWRALKQAMSAARREERAPSSGTGRLPPLNPDWSDAHSK